MALHHRSKIFSLVKDNSGKKPANAYTIMSLFKMQSTKLAQLLASMLLPRPATVNTVMFHVSEMCPFHMPS